MLSMMAIVAVTVTNDKDRHNFLVAQLALFLRTSFTTQQTVSGREDSWS